MPLNGKCLSTKEALHLILKTTDNESSDIDILSHYDPPALLVPATMKISQPEKALQWRPLVPLNPT